MSDAVISETRPLFTAWRSGDDTAHDRLLRQYYPDLERIAGALLRRERNVSLASADVVQEAVLRMIQLRRIDFDTRAHFLALASRFMRRVLIDHVRAKQADKRQHQRVTLVTRVQGRSRQIDLMGLEQALVRLGLIDAQRAEIVEMRYFGGMTLADIAEVMGLSEATVKRRWTSARAWLLDAMEDPFVPARFDA